jgi:heme/copper-type cytochrome/quinol oxidase subunit 2
MPLILIIIIILISLKILFFNNNKIINILSIKILRNQWFWIYEYLNFNKFFFSYIIYKNYFNFYFLETDNRLILPFNFNIQVFISSLDVIHSWSIPSINFKLDSIPNQINIKIINLIKSTIFFGQCSEICGLNHSFIPIKVESIKINNFIIWMKN